MMRGIITRSLTKHADERGWLVELFRDDELGEVPRPTMSYISLTQPGVGRGPHEHATQTDVFCFLGPSNFRLVLWDNRNGSETFGQKLTLCVGQDNPMLVVVPPGVVHGYKNIGTVPGMVINLPDRLYKGMGRREAVDEIRHELAMNSPFTLD